MNTTGLNVVGFNTKFEIRKEKMKSDPSWITPRLIDDLPKIAEKIEETTIKAISGKTRKESIDEIASILQQSKESVIDDFKENSPILRVDVMRIVLIDLQDKIMREEEEIFIILLAFLARRKIL